MVKPYTQRNLIQGQSKKFYSESECLIMKKNILQLLLNASLSANLMVLITWVITVSMGYTMIQPTILFKNMAVVIAIVTVATIFGWFYKTNEQPFILGSLHFLATFITFLGLGLWANWFPFKMGSILSSTLIFILIF